MPQGQRKYRVAYTSEWLAGVRRMPRCFLESAISQLDQAIVCRFGGGGRDFVLGQLAFCGRLSLPEAGHACYAIWTNTSRQDTYHWRLSKCAGIGRSQESCAS